MLLRFPAAMFVFAVWTTRMVGQINLRLALIGSLLAVGPVYAQTPAQPRSPAQNRAVEDGTTVQQSSPPRFATPYVRPYGPKAPWNVPVTHLPTHPDSESLVHRLYLEPDADRAARFQVTLDTHTFAAYDTATAVMPTPLKTFHAGNLKGKIPWNPMWKPPIGTEGRMIVLDFAHGLEWNLSEAGYRFYVIQARTANLVPGDFRTNEGGFLESRGSGLPYLAMLVRPEEVQAGKIEHALSMTARTLSSTEFYAPALKKEFLRTAPAGVPAGIRYSLKVSDEDIDRWLRGLPKELPEPMKRTGRVLAEALRDYGWFVTDYAPASMMQLESRVSAEREWSSLGMEIVKVRQREYPRDLLDGLITPERITAYVPSNEYPAEWRTGR